MTRRPTGRASAAITPPPEPAAPPAAAPRVPGLVVVHPGGHGQRPHLRVFAPREVDVCIGELLVTYPANEALAEELLRLRLPLRYRDLYLPGYERRSWTIEGWDVADEADRVLGLAVIRGLRELGEHA